MSKMVTFKKSLDEKKQSEDNKFRILLVDDFKEVTQVLKCRLEKFVFMGRGIEVDTALSAENAMSLIKSNDYAVGIFDVVMEKEDSGLQLVEWVRNVKKNYTMRIIIHTGQPADFPKELVVKKYDINAYIEKGHSTGSDVENILSLELRTYFELNKRINENLALQNKLAESEKLAAIATLSAGINHEVGNALNAIMAATRGIKKRIDESENGKAFDVEGLKNTHRLIKKGLQRAYDIIDGLSVSVRKDVKSKEFFSLKKGIQDSIYITSEKVRKAGVDLKVEVDPRLEIEFNRTALSQVFTNLIINACDALEDTSRPAITIRSEVSGDQLKVTFTDNGPGIPDKIADQIFLPLFTTKDPGKGTGLGLHMIRTVVHDLGGNIDLNRSNPNGAQFVLSLPIFRLADEEMAS